MKVFYLPESSCQLSAAALRESMRRWHWHRYFVTLRAIAEEADIFVLEVLQPRAHMHRKLAQSLEHHANSPG